MTYTEGTRVRLKNGNCIGRDYPDGRARFTNKGIITLYVSYNEVYIKLDGIDEKIKTSLENWEAI